MATRKIPQLAGDTLTRWVKRQQLESGFRRCELALRWHELVGKRVAARTSPRELRQGVLTVEVSGSAWLNELSFLRETLREQINKVMGRALVSELRFVLRTGVGHAPPPAPKLAPEPPPPGPGQRAAARHTAEQEIPELEDRELRETIAQARGAQLLKRR